MSETSSQAAVAHATHDHIVQFYEDDSYLVDVVAPFLAQGLERGDQVIVLATGVHRAQLSARMVANGVDVDAATRSGKLKMRDAHDVLAEIMVDGEPDWIRFRTTVGSLIEPEVPVCAFGELVNLLTLSGRANAAIKLEGMWNRISQTHPIALLCGYHIDGFTRDADGAAFDAVCATHNDVRPTETWANLAEDDERRRQISVLQRRARALETEISRRRKLEDSLREAMDASGKVAEELRRSQAELADFFDNAAEGLHWVGPDGTILWANRAELELLGYLDEEYVGRNIVEFHADRPVIDDILARLGRNETVRNQEARLVCKDGSLRHVLIHSNALWRDGELIHSRCFTRDITARKQVEDELRTAETERSRLLAQEQAARREAEAANRAKDEFLAMLGHELRNPLTPILTAVELLRMRGESNREIDVIERQAGHISRLVDDLLDVSRISRGNLEIRRTRVEMWDVVTDAIETASTLLEQRRHILAIEVPRHGCVVDGDRSRMAQIVSNLLTNAAKYSDPGTRIVIAVTSTGGTVTLRVRDHGIGIAPEMLDQIFEAFVQQPQAIDRSHGGLGLGLAIVRSLVGLHGGSVSVRSDGVGLGSEFIVVLPAAPPDAVTTQRMTTLSSTGARVMIVDDNADAAMLLAAALTEHGYAVRVAHDGPSALALAKDFSPEIGLVDIGLPVMDGYELAGHLQREPLTARMRLIAITGYGQETDRARAKDAGFSEHLIKPVDLAVVRRVVGRASAISR